MGCVSSNLLRNEDELSQLGGSALSHHIVSLTSTTYGLLNLDPSPSVSVNATSPPTPPPRFTLGSIFPTPLTESKSLWSDPRPLRPDHHQLPEVINSWELMSGLDADSFRFSPIIKRDQTHFFNKENSNPNNVTYTAPSKCLKESSTAPHALDRFEKLCPPNGENKVVIYTTTLRGIRNTFEACNVVRAALEGFEVAVCERDVSMDRGFREELRELMKEKEKEKDAMVPPQVFVRGRYLGGAEEMTRIVEEGWMGELLQGLPKKRTRDACEGCGDVRFLPCFRCNGSCKMAMMVKEEAGIKQGKNEVVRCPDCNENGLVLCPICC